MLSYVSLLGFGRILSYIHVGEYRHEDSTGRKSVIITAID